MSSFEAVELKAPCKLEILLQTVFARVDEYIVSHFLCCKCLLIKLTRQFHLS